MSSALDEDLEGLHSSWVADTVVPTNILNQHDSDWSQVNSRRICLEGDVLDFQC